MDNKEISIQLAGRAAFDLAFKVAFMSEYDENNPKQKATHYVDHPEYGLILFWSNDKSYNSIPLPTPLNWEEAANLAWTWLTNLPKDRYEEYPDLDGSASQGFKVYNTIWASNGWSYAIIAVKPIWALHGK